MKKIFLTSGLVLCMASPAFATAGADIGTADITATNGSADAANCVSDVLETSTAGATVDFTALWNPNDGSITLHNDSSYTQQACGAGNNATVAHTSSDNTWSTIFSASTPDELFTKYGVAVYSTSTARDADTNNAGTGGITALTTKPTLTGYTFGGYYDTAAHAAAGGSTGLYIEDDKDFVMGTGTRASHAELDQYVTASGGTGDLYARWTPKSYTGGITYACGSANGSSVSAAANADSTQDVVFDDCFELATGASQCTAPAGYVFGGWSCNQDLPNVTKSLPADNTDAVGYPNNTQNLSLYEGGAAGVWGIDLANDATVTCTAIWKANAINLTWDADGGTASGGGTYEPGENTDKCIYNGAITLPANPVKTGYTFAGWDVTTVTEPSSGSNPNGGSPTDGGDTQGL